MLIDTLRAYSKIMSENEYNSPNEPDWSWSEAHISPCRCVDCVEFYTKTQKLAIVNTIVKNMSIKGNFEDCRACKFLLENTNVSELIVCDNCNHLHKEKKCECRYYDDDGFYYNHKIETYVRGVCPYCESEDVEYELGLDNSIKFLLDDDTAYFIVKCLDCKRTSHENYIINFTAMEGVE